ncbi:Venom allergen 5 [Amphibalanus amphitrite]|uniref:Venom allergen 5 n=1 Tax=Amphibalanus amphitrite TaxID=1232801 RepID=A0A6A4WNP6_AMPAM|nr:Venom allergen 5 [Amphibalanus amphitrite]
MARPASLLALLMPALCALAQMDNRQHQELLQQSRMQQQLFRVLPDHQQPKFDSDDGGDHYPARTSDHYCNLFGRHSLCQRYDVELHDVAQGAADRCVDGHDCHECRQVARGHVGQNVAQRSFSMGRGPLSRQQLLRVNLRPLDAMGGWLEELTRLGSSDVHSLSGGTGAGHYTQVIWATTEMLGCGWIEHAERGGLSGTTCSTEYPGLCKRL